MKIKRGGDFLLNLRLTALSRCLRKALMESPRPEERCLQASVDIVPQRLGWCLAKVDITLTSRTRELSHV